MFQSFAVEITNTMPSHSDLVSGLQVKVGGWSCRWRWKLKDGGWKLEVDGLILEVVGWRLDVGGWRSRVEG